MKKILLIAIVILWTLSACNAPAASSMPTPAVPGAVNPIPTAESIPGDQELKTVHCADLISESDLLRLLNTEAVELEEFAYPGGTSCDWNYLPKDGMGNTFFQIVISFTDLTVDTWQSAREAEIWNEDSDLVVNSIAGLADENYTWISNNSITRVLYARQGNRTLVLRYSTEIIGLMSESQLIDFVDRLFSRF